MPLKLPAGMTVAYENSASSSYLIAGVGEGVQIIGYQVSMLERNKPGNLLHMDARRRNGTVALCYDITSRLALEFLLKRKKLKRNEFIKLLSDLCRPLIDCEGFLLKDSGFLLDAGCIYANPETLEIYMVYLPVRLEENTAETFKSFVMDLVLNHAGIDETGCDNFLQRILGFLKRDGFNARDFLALLDELLYLPQAQTTFAAGNAAGSEAPEPVKVDVKNAVGTAKDKKWLRLAAALLSQVFIAFLIVACRRLLAGIPGNAGVTYGAVVLIVLAIDVMLFRRLFFGKPAADAAAGSGKKPGKVMYKTFDSGPTVKEAAVQPATGAARTPVQARTELLGYRKPECPVLRSRNSPDFEEISIDKPEFVIGRLADQVDHVCKNNAVGKVHALITSRDGILNIRDLNSVNGTFVNDSRIESNNDIEIKDGDAIMLANSEYVLVMK